MSYDFKIKTCKTARKWIAAQIGYSAEDITVDKAARKIIVTVQIAGHTDVFTVEDAPFIYTIPDQQWLDVLDQIKKKRGDT